MKRPSTKVAGHLPSLTRLKDGPGKKLDLLVGFGFFLVFFLNNQWPVGLCTLLSMGVWNSPLAPISLLLLGVGLTSCSGGNSPLAPISLLFLGVGLTSCSGGDHYLSTNNPLYSTPSRGRSNGGEGPEGLPEKKI